MSGPPKTRFCIGCRGRCNVDHLEELLRERVYSATDQWEALRLLKREIVIRTEKFNKESNLSPEN